MGGQKEKEKQLKCKGKKKNETLTYVNAQLQNKLEKSANTTIYWARQGQKVHCNKDNCCCILTVTSATKQILTAQQ